MEKRPKRRKSKDNPYTIICSLEKSKYVIIFKNINNIEQQIEVTKEIYDVFNYFELKDIVQMNEFDRHIEHSNVITENLYQRMYKQPKSVENIVLEKIEKQKLYNAISALPKKQRKRIILYYFNNLTQDQMAKKEKCSIRAIQYSLSIALKNLRKFLK